MDRELEEALALNFGVPRGKGNEGSNLPRTDVDNHVFDGPE